MRATNYTLIVGTNADLQSGILRTVSQTETSYTTTFDQDYPQLYWKVIGINEYGTTEHETWEVGIDPTPPTSAINTAQTPALVYDIQIPVSWSGSDDRSGIHTYDIQVREDADGVWKDWLTGFPNTAAIYTGQPGHRYAFRVRAHDIAGNTEAYPSDPDIIVTVDLTKRPPQVWGSPESRLKYGVLVVNPQASTVIPSGYPVHLRFDSSTTPTAAEIYAASTAIEKGADLRIWYNDQTELPRYLAKFNTAVIDLWFPTQAVIAASGSSSAYALYLDHPQATPPSSAPESVLVPGTDASTQVLMYFDEVNGATATDHSGKGNHGSIQGAVTRPAGKFGTALSFNGNTAVSIPHATSLQFGNQLTIEAWVRPTLLDPNTRNIVAKMAPNQGSAFRLYTRDNGYLVFDIYSDGAQSRVEFPNGLTLNQWSHIAAVYDGTSLRLVVNGVEKRMVVYNRPISAATAALVVGNTGYGNEPFVGDIDQLRISNSGRTAFSYGTVLINPTAAAGVRQVRENRGPTQLVLQDVHTQSSPEGGLLVQAVIHNSGVYSTYNQVRTDIYVNYIPAGPNDLQHSVGHWVTDSILPGTTITLTKVIAAGDLPAARSQLQPPWDQSVALTVQVDSLGMVQSTPGSPPVIVSEPPVCVGIPDPYEDDGTPAQAQILASGSGQHRTFDRLADQDWMAFTALQGITYTIQTTQLAPTVDTILTLYDQDQTTILAENDDVNGELSSMLIWKAPTSGTYYINVRN